MCQSVCQSVLTNDEGEPPLTSHNYFSFHLWPLDSFNLHSISEGNLLFVFACTSGTGGRENRTTVHPAAPKSLLHPQPFMLRPSHFIWVRLMENDSPLLSLCSVSAASPLAIFILRTYMKGESVWHWLRPASIFILKYPLNVCVPWKLRSEKSIH